FYLAGWASKLSGAIARIAGILHLANGSPPGTPISEMTAQAAIRLGRDYLLPHALAAFAVMGADERLEDGKRVLRWLGEQFCENVKSVIDVQNLQISKRQIHSGVFGGSRKAEEVDRIIGLLVHHGYLRPLETEPQSRARPGRKPSERFQVHPQVKNVRS